jgi:hypothetical protein
MAYANKDSREHVLALPVGLTILLHVLCDALRAHTAICDSVGDVLGNRAEAILPGAGSDGFRYELFLNLGRHVCHCVWEHGVFEQELAPFKPGPVSKSSNVVPQQE